MPKQSSVAGEAIEILSKARRTSGTAQKFYTIAHVAEMLEVSSRTVRRWIKEGHLGVLRVGGVVRIGDANLKAFIAIHHEH
jgi:excisionase family DNA binding protein